MISSLRLSNLKRFARLELALGQLTVLTGLNGSGKSTVIQGLLLAHRASLSTTGIVSLSDQSGLDLGRAGDVLHTAAESPRIEIVAEAEDQTHEWSFDVSPAGAADPPYLTVSGRPGRDVTALGSAGARFTYLAAERLGPRTSHPVDPVREGDFAVGMDGRFVANALAVCGRREIPVKRRHPRAGNVSTLSAQVEAWLADLVGETQLEATLVPRTSLATLRIRRVGGAGEWMLPTNTGFGVSYCLPVVVAGLLVPEDGLLIVDSPEAHLHPAAQSAIGRFLSEVAASGVQVIIESHSDHVLNGIRRSVATGRIGHNQVGVTFFGDDEPQTISMLASGSLSRWPEGFFDQIENDLGELANAALR